ncbi:MULTISPECIES: GNAT family N-acetyltransferase [unclassified Photobacterium]|uniref:GNAT family N-acetyltransferase n=1 Tax=unclassified Photobacterium TaxID=2628852 RepID=UPI000D156CB2|nr:MULTISPECIES: GNAT family N-acetyltransferase [unclassified Photobacterium]PSV25424.1 GNAT family N-acetyltransferase [Photobacterium sp. GB-56]PSV30071.1 GNAT family N-acetyltransferase [Photobacterium sp. GB-72]PSV34025.1 GNAT family N-acetyltransferase [Photobacterium sp. GB-27]PSV38055.1 GNAT family N-acetyltransferase [Photobacterium sp. GB-210]PSV41831.1 GNAT family N-acetyltransferase [Photobacterium sp. GB-36]
MLVILRYTEKDQEGVKAVSLFEDQILFAATADDFLESESATMHLYVIKLNSQIVGFFKIDIAYSHDVDFCSENCIGLRTFVIDQKLQGKGIGKQALMVLFTYLAKNYSNYQRIYLTVNCKNTVAKRCYETAGFTFTGERYLGGLFGPQEIMYHDI